jgi:hypothetical protein
MTTAPPEGTRPDDPEEEEEVYPPDFIYPGTKSGRKARRKGGRG